MAEDKALIAARTINNVHNGDHITDYEMKITIKFLEPVIRFLGGTGSGDGVSYECCDEYRTEYGEEEFVATYQEAEAAIQTKKDMKFGR